MALYQISTCFEILDQDQKFVSFLLKTTLKYYSPTYTHKFMMNVRQQSQYFIQVAEVFLVKIRAGPVIKNSIILLLDISDYVLTYL